MRLLPRLGGGGGRGGWALFILLQTGGHLEKDSGGWWVGEGRLEMSLPRVGISRSPRYVNSRNKNHIFSELTL